jgi:hypothetical protein
MVLHAVGSEGFGVWAAAASFFWMTVVVDFGVGQALLTTVAQNVAWGDIAEIRRQIGPRCWCRSSWLLLEPFSRSRSFQGSRRREKIVGVRD